MTITKDDVVKLFKRWRAAGLQPPVSYGDLDAQQNMIDGFYRQYWHLTPEEMEVLADVLSRGRTWAKFCDIDDTLKDFREHGIRTWQGDYRHDKDAFIRREIALLPKVDDSIVACMATAEAKISFPDATESFIYDNRLDLAWAFQERLACKFCTGGNRETCDSGGHQAFLRVDKDGGFTVPCRDVDVCSKYLRR